MFTRKDFVLIAERINNINDEEKAWDEMSRYSEIFAVSNPRFNQDKFTKACGFTILKGDQNYEADAKF